MSDNPDGPKPDAPNPAPESENVSKKKDSGGGGKADSKGDTTLSSLPSVEGSKDNAFTAAAEEEAPECDHGCHTLDLSSANVTRQSVFPPGINPKTLAVVSCKLCYPRHVVVSNGKPTWEESLASKMPLLKVTLDADNVEVQVASRKKSSRK